MWQSAVVQAALRRDSGRVDSMTVVGEKGGLTRNHNLGFRDLFSISNNELVDRLGKMRGAYFYFNSKSQ